MRSVIVAVAVVALTACSTYDSVTQRIAQSVTPYRITVVQGNFVSAEQAAQLHAGMTRDEVRTLLGTPLLTDMFHADRWDYVFYFKRGFKVVVQERDLVLHFSGDTLTSWTGAENLPSELDLLADIDGQKVRKAPAAASAASAVTAAAPAAEALPQTGGSPNEQAAHAANVATDAVSGQGGQAQPVRVPTMPNQGGMPSNATAQPQIQFHNQKAPASPGDASAVGPQGTAGLGTDGLSNQPLTNPAN